MARTYNDIYYNDDENSTAEILDDMKKLAESVDQQIGSIKSFNNDTSQFIEQVTPLMSNLSEQVIDMHQLADTMFTELEQVKEENKQLRQDLNGLPKGQASGESIDLNDSAEMRFSEFYVRGNSKQETRAGYNLLNFDVKQNSRVTYNNEDGTITINGQGGFTLAFKQFTAKANTKYYIKWELVSGTVDTSKSNGNSFLSSLDNKNIKQGEFKESVVESDKDITGFWVNNMIVFTNAVIKFWANTNKSDFEQYGASPSPEYPSEVECCGDNINIFDGEVEEGNIDASTGQNTAVTNAWRSKNYLNVKDTSVSISVKDLTFSGTVGKLYFYKSDNTYISNILINSLPFTATLPNETAKVRFFILNSVADINAKIKLEKGSTATPYSPYGQGCINEVICNKNLISIDDITRTDVGVTITKNGDTFVINGTVSDSKLLVFNPSKILKVLGDYTLSVKYVSGLKSGLSNFNLRDYETNSLLLNANLTTSDTSDTSDTSATITIESITQIKYGIYLVSGTTFTNYTFKVQLEKGTTATDYVEHQSQTYTIPTQQPMKSVGDTRDTFIKKNNKWYERHYTYRKIFDGTESFGIKSQTEEYIVFERNQTGKARGFTNIICSHFKTLNSTTEECVRGSTGSSYVFINISKGRLSSMDSYGLKEWLTAQYNAGTPVYVDYVLEEPLDIECTEEQSTILFDIEQNAKTYDKVTHMYSTDKISSYKEVTYKKDIETLFANTLVESGV